MKKNRLGCFIFLAPALFIFFITVFLPTLMNFLYSVIEFDERGLFKSFIGFENFIQIFTTDRNWSSSSTLTTKILITSSLLSIFVGLFLAVLMEKKLKNSKFFRKVFFMPNLVGGLFLGLVWKFFFTYAFVDLKKLTGLHFFNNWLTTPKGYFFALVLMNVWQLSGCFALIYISQLQKITDDIKDAAKIDGASSFQIFFRITLPSTKRASMVCFFICAVNVMKMFEQNLILTDESFLNSNQTLTFNIYKTAFLDENFSAAQTKSIALIAVVALVYLATRIFKKKEEVEI